MALVTYLKIMGCVTARPNWVANTCYWSFSPCPDLRRHIEIFQARAALVEPTEYNRVFGDTKREFYDTRPALAEA